MGDKTYTDIEAHMFTSLSSVRSKTNPFKLDYAKARWLVSFIDKYSELTDCI